MMLHAREEKEIVLEIWFKVNLRWASPEFHSGVQLTTLHSNPHVHCQQLGKLRH